MTDQSSGEAAPAGFETKNLPHGVAPAPVPYTDTTHIDRGETGAVGEQPAPSAEQPTEEKKTTATRKSSTTKDG